MNKFQSETYINDPMDISDDDIGDKFHGNESLRDKSFKDECIGDKFHGNESESFKDKIQEKFEEALFDLYNDDIGNEFQQNESQQNENPSYLETRRYLVAPRTSQQPINIQPINTQPINIYDVNDYKINPLNI